jgi:ribonuclease BN (tRNA processing enzyme)
VDSCSLFYSGDTGYSPKITKFAKNADIGIIECSHPDEHAIEGHLTPSQTGKIAKEADIKHLVVTHIYPENDTASLLDRIRNYYSGKITIARDFMELNTP